MRKWSSTRRLSRPYRRRLSKAKFEIGMKAFGKYFCALLVLTAFRSFTADAAEVVERILAVVNDEIVTEQDLEVVMAPILAQYRASYTGRELEERLREMREQFERKVIEDRLVLS